MKSEHRHELAENDLAKVLGRWGTEFDKHANTILTVLIVITLAAGGYIYWSRTTSATNAAGWTELTAAGTAEEYANVAELFPGTPIAAWATLRAADRFLEEGIRLSLTDRPVSNERLQQARESYDSLLHSRSVPDEIREQALIGYAVTLETLSDGDTSDAIAAYQALIDEFGNSRFKVFAEDRIKSLKTGGVQNFYAWFSQLNPQPAARPMPQDQTGSIDPNALGNLLPEAGGSGIPELPPLELPDTGAGDVPEDDPNPFAVDEEMKDRPASGEEGDSPRDEAPPDEASPVETNQEAPAPESPEQKPPAEQTPSTPEKPVPDGSTSEDSPADETTEPEQSNTPESP